MRTIRCTGPSRVLMGGSTIAAWNRTPGHFLPVTIGRSRMSPWKLPQVATVMWICGTLGRVAVGKTLRRNASLSPGNSPIVQS
jgi:hypothetical protein